MSKKMPAEAGRFQHIYEAGLKWAAFVIGALHLLLSMLYYFFKSLTLSLRSAEKWAVLVLLVAVVIYLIVTKTKYPRLMPRIRNFTQKLFLPELTILIIFFAWFLICTISANERYTANFFAINDSDLFNVFVDTFILFPMACYLADSGSQRIAEIFIHFVLAILTGVMIFVLYRLLTLNIINLPDGGQIGMNKNARLVINCNPNTTGAVSEIIMVLCLFMILYKKGIIRLLYIFAFAVHFIILIFSNSRACFYASALATAFLAAKVVYDRLTGRKNVIRILSSVGIAAAVVGLFFLLRKFIFFEFENITHFSKLINRKSVERDLDLDSNGRIKIWKAALRSISTDIKHIIFGVTPSGVISEISIQTNGKSKVYAHNEFLEIAVSVGLPGLAMYCIWLYRQARYCIIDTLKKPAFYLAAMMLMLVVANLAESTLMFYWFLPESVFFLTAGMITYSRKNSPFK